MTAGQQIHKIFVILLQRVYTKILSCGDTTAAAVVVVMRMGKESLEEGREGRRDVTSTLSTVAMTTGFPAIIGGLRR